MKPSPSPSRIWRLVLPDGSARRIEPAGLLIGRGLDVDVIVDDPSASRRHAMITLTSSGPRLSPLSTGPTWVDGERVDAPCILAPGSRIRLPGLELVVDAESTALEPRSEPVWVIEREGGAAFGIGDAGLSMGGAAEDDIHVPGWDAHALRFHVVDGWLSVECGTPIRLDARPIEAGALEPLERGSRICCGELRLRVLAGSTPTSERTTRQSDASPHAALPTRVSLTFLPRGGRLELSIGRREHALVLSEKRCELMACLLRPPRPYAAGELVPDETLGTRLWPGRAVVRTHVNVLVHRLRRDLVAAGIDGARLVTRADQGHATRIALAPGAIVSVE